MRRRRLHLLRDGAARDPGREPGAGSSSGRGRAAPGTGIPPGDGRAPGSRLGPGRRLRARSVALEDRPRLGSAESSRPGQHLEAGSCRAGGPARCQPPPEVRLLWGGRCGAGHARCLPQQLVPVAFCTDLPKFFVFLAEKLGAVSPSWELGSPPGHRRSAGSSRSLCLGGELCWPPARWPGDGARCLGGFVFLGSFEAFSASFLPPSSGMRLELVREKEHLGKEVRVPGREGKQDGRIYPEQSDKRGAKPCAHQQQRQLLTAAVSARW